MDDHGTTGTVTQGDEKQTSLLDYSMTMGGTGAVQDSTTELHAAACVESTLKDGAGGPEQRAETAQYENCTVRRKYHELEWSSGESTVTQHTERKLYTNEGETDEQGIDGSAE
ncbi:hypothetical protein PF001_g4575 [Phytophthora fragariae]|uniref:Uncharacterized protein n=1 Tax=Phytophthora fragariae TaxID=53985 RepID=A0A6A4EGN5_9STRA|nr:hypothetical protein PF001_g4575 [Phytophthora fragariae]